MSEKYPTAQKMRQKAHISISPDWQKEARCSEAVKNGELPPSTFICGTMESAEVAKPFCQQCPVARDCLAYALQEETAASGIYGGVLMDEGEVVTADTNRIRSTFPGHFR